jgi:hypothetical protein
VISEKKRNDEMTTDLGKYVDDHSDLTQNLRLSKLLQALSAELAPGPNRLDAQAGDVLAYFQDNTSKVYSRVPGMPFVGVAFLEMAMEWPPDRGSGAGPVAAHDFVPADAEWVVVDGGGRKACIRASNGNRIEKTVFLHALVEGQPVTFPFRSTALEIGKRLAADADRVRVQVDGETVRVVGAIYRLSSELERKGTQSWYRPTFERLGVLGEPSGPPLELVRRAKTLRFESKLEEERKKKEHLAAIPAPRPTPALISPDPPRGTASFTTGIASRWSDPKPPEPPAPSANRADPDDPIPW